MRRFPQLLSLLLIGALFLGMAGEVRGQALTNRQARIKSAMSAAPPSISANATILDYPSDPGGEKVLLRQGINEWTCLPDNPDLPAENPMCVDDQWMDFFDAYADKREPQITRMGFAYLLQGAVPRSNTNPEDTGPTPENEWMQEQVPHVGILVPDKALLEGMPTDPNNGGPWVMWRDTPYVHIIVPVPRYEPKEEESASSGR